jgi:PBP1b-binding outer membrane lipoprotein LpoB
MRLIICSLILVVCGAFFLAGCSSDAEQESSVHEYYVEKVNNLDYIKDERTGLCFATYSMYQDTLFTNVPCDKVESLIKGKYVEAHYEAAK